jgi:flavin reductase (DIM6/NTAB) family NADH-FMN oxidoreductase RutF
VSLEPPLILACIEKTTGSHDAIVESGKFAANVLGARQDELSERFSIPFTDKFIGVSFRVGLGGIPILNDALVTLECNLHRSYDGGDHTIFVGEVERAEIRDGDPLVYFHGNYRDLLQP